jgi:hypothetical protein
VDAELRGKWIWPLLLVAAVVAIVAVELAQGWSADGDQVPAASESVAAAGPDARLLAPGEVVTIDALDASGTWGTIAITRGADTGGYPDNPIEPDAFVIEVHIEYTAGRYPQEPEEFGREDWALATAADHRPVGSLYEWVHPANPSEWVVERQELGVFPGAMEIIGEPIGGMLYFQVPRELADQALELVYRPVRLTEATAILIREGGPAPAPVAAATPVPPPAAVSYVEREGLPFAVIDSPEAESLFVNPDTCTNPVGGFTVSYPDSWYTNTEFGAVPACSWFSPTSYEVTTPEAVPGEVVITISVISGTMGSFTRPDRSLDEPVPIGRRDGRRWEEVGVTYEGGGYEALPPSYSYFLVLGDPAGDGPRILASSRSEGVDNYVLNKAVLDRIMASLQFTD